MLRSALSVSLIVALAQSAFAQTGPGPASHDPAQVQAGSYKIDPNHTQVLFSVSHMGFSEFSGRFSGVTGSLRLDPNALASTSLDVTIPVASVSTPSDQLNGELRGASWLDAGQYADMRFRSLRVVSTGPGLADIVGDLTLHGVTRPVTLQARFVGAGMNPLDKAYTVGFQAVGVLSRSAFGVKTYVPLIGDRVTVTLNGSFEKRA